MPKGIDALCAWLAEVSAEELPDRLHDRGVWRDHGAHAEGGSHLGSPVLHDDFRRFIEDSPSQLDEDGYFRTPYRAMLSRLRRNHSVPAWHVSKLATLLADPTSGGWRRLGKQLLQHEQVAEIYLSEALRMAWIEYQVTRLE